MSNKILKQSNVFRTVGCVTDEELFYPEMWM